MRNKYFVSISIFINIVLIVLIVLLCLLIINRGNNKIGYDIVQANIEKLDNDLKDKIVQEIYSVEEISQNKKKEIAINLFDEYINSRRTNWEYSKEKGDNTVALALTDYRVTDTKFIHEDLNKFTFEIIFDVKYTDDTNYWCAGVGDFAADNWLLNKFMYITIIKYQDKYYMYDISSESPYL